MLVVEVWGGGGAGGDNLSVHYGQGTTLVKSMLSIS